VVDMGGTRVRLAVVVDAVLLNPVLDGAGYPMLGRGPGVREIGCSPLGSGRVLLARPSPAGGKTAVGRSFGGGVVLAACCRSSSPGSGARSPRRRAIDSLIAVRRLSTHRRRISSAIDPAADRYAGSCCFSGDLATGAGSAGARRTTGGARATCARF
jgi:hypothetical protein